MGTGKRILAFLALAAALTAWGLRPARATDVWTPDTGDVKLEELPRDTAEAQFRHASALIAAGQAKSGVNILRSLLKDNPKADWAEKAHYTLALGLFVEGKYEDAFEEWQEFRMRHPLSESGPAALDMQLAAANQLAREDLDPALKLYDRLLVLAPDKEFEARCQKDKADAMLAAGKPLEASHEYLALIDYHPDSQWVPYAWYRIAQCYLATAKWIGRGSQYLEDAGRGYQDYLDSFPNHAMAEQAKQELSEVRALQAQTYMEAAYYYLGPGRKPTAALAYISLTKEAVPGSAQSRWADEKTREVLAGEQAPLRGQVQKMPLKGVSAPKPQEPK